MFAAAENHSLEAMTPVVVLCHSEKPGLDGQGWTNVAKETPGFRQSPPIPATPASSCDKALLQSSSRWQEIDGLRGAAILLVVGKHYGFGQLTGPSEAFGVRLFNRLCPMLSGVDLFFVLTGYLLGGQLLDSLGKPRVHTKFYLRRACRTFPLYYLVLLAFSASVLTGEMRLVSFDLDVKWPFGTPWSLVAYALFVQNFLVAVQGYLGPAWLMVTWSLATQEQFYLLLPCLLRLSPRHVLGYVLVGLFLSGPLSRLALACVLPAWSLNTCDGLLFCRTDSLGIGVLVAWLLRQEGARNLLMKYRKYFSPLAIVLFAGTCLLAYFKLVLGSRALFVCGHTLLAVLYMDIVLIACFAADSMWGRVLRIRPLGELGRISYGVFLLHLIIRDLLFRGVLGITPTRNGWEHWLPTLVAFLLTVMVAEISWRFLERPIIGWAKSTWPRSNHDR